MKVRMLYLAAVFLAATGIALRLAPASAPASPLAFVAPAAISAAPRAEPIDSTAFAGIIASNVFSSTRTAPASRMLPDGTRKDTTPALAPRPRARPPAEPRIRLYGITRGAGGAVALIEADPQVPGAEVYRVGDRIPGGRVATITDSTVTVERSSGPLILRLPAVDGEHR